MSGCLDGYQVIVPLVIPEETKLLVANLYKTACTHYEEIEAIDFDYEDEPLVTMLEGLEPDETAALGLITVREAKALVAMLEKEITDFLNDPQGTFCRYNYMATTTFTTAKQQYIVAFAGEITYGDTPSSAEYCLLAAVNSFLSLLLDDVL